MIKEIRMKKVRLFLPLLLIILSIATYFINTYYIAYLLMPWQDFGEIPVEVVKILNFTDKTSATIGYVEPGTTKVFTCKESIIYVEMEGGDVFRCCNSPEKVSCVKNDMSNNYVADKECEDWLNKTFGIPKHLPHTKDYKTFGHCPSSGVPKITTVQITDGNEVLWKSIPTLYLDFTVLVLKCIVAPCVFILSLFMVAIAVIPIK